MKEWISVEDSLPEEFVDVLVCAQSSVGNPIAEDEFYHAIDRICIWNDGHPRSFRTSRFYGRVTHWMPLPELPEVK